MKVLIAGSDINAKLLASYLKIEDKENDIYVTTDEVSVDSSYIPINIKENDIPAICDFVKYNQIEFTIATSPMAIINGIADEFKKEGFLVFAPISEAARITFFNSIAKKVMYKLKIPTPRFGIFDRENLALDYVRNIKFPISVGCDFSLLSNFNYTFHNFSKAKDGIQRIFEDGNNKVVIENYLDTEPVYLYFITDGYNALPLSSVERSEQEGFTLALSPASKISEEMTINVLQKVIYPLLDDISKYTDMYTGILGLKCKIYKNSIYVLEFYNGFKDIDFQTFLPNFNDKMLKILYETAIGALNDSRDFIKTTDGYSYTVAIDKNKIKMTEDDEEDFVYSEDGEKYIITSFASTINKAKMELQEYIQPLVEEDTYKKIIEKSLCKEPKI